MTLALLPLLCPQTAVADVPLYPTQQGVAFEGGTVSVRVFIPDPSPGTKPLSVRYTLANGTANGSDYIGPGNYTAPVQGNEAMIDIPTTGDTLVEPTESFFVTVEGYPAVPVAILTDEHGAGMGRIAWSASRDGKNRLYHANSDGSTNAREIQITPGIHFAYTGGGRNPALSPRGNSFAFVSDDGRILNANIAFNPTGTTDEAVPALFTSGPGDTDPAFSPDGQTIAFSSYRNGLDPQIYVQTGLGTTPRQITFSSNVANVQPAFSSDGRHIVFARYFDPNNSQIVVADTQNSHEVVVVSASGLQSVSSPQFDPSGKRIAYTFSDGGNSEGPVIRAVKLLDDGAITVESVNAHNGVVSTFNPTATVPTYETTIGGNSTAFRPDGGALALSSTYTSFVADTSTNQDVLVLRPPVTSGSTTTYYTPQQLSTGAGDSIEPSWTVNLPDAPRNLSLTTSSSPSNPSDSPNVVRSFVATYYDPDGEKDIRDVYLQFSATPTTGPVTDGLRTYYDVRNNLLYLLNNTGTGYIGGFAPGTATVISNTRGNLHCATTTVTRYPDRVVVRWSMSATTAIAGTTKNAYLYVRDTAGLTDGLDQFGTWAIN